MPSKQKKKKKSGRGKAKKVAVGRSKHTKKDEKQQAAIDIDAQMEQSIDVQKKQLMISGSDNSQPYDEDSLLEEAIKLAAVEREALKSGTGEKKESTSKPKRKGSRSWECHHGYKPKGREVHAIIDDFCKTFWSQYITADKELMQCVTDAFSATYEKYPEIWNDEPKLKLARSMYLMYGTQSILKGKWTVARSFAFLAYHFEDFINVHRDENKGNTTLLLQDDLLYADEHTLVKYLRKNIPCACLDKKYKEVKSVTKMGLCCNSDCSQHMVKRSSMLFCDRCRYVSYCSRSCQKADWPWHKEFCDHICKTPMGTMTISDSWLEAGGNSCSQRVSLCAVDEYGSDTK